MKGQGMLISAFAFALVIAIFAVINVETVQVNFLFTKTSTPLILVILVSTLLGGLTVGLFGMIRIYRLQRQVKGLEKQLAAGAADNAGERAWEEAHDENAGHMELLQHDETSDEVKPLEDATADRRDDAADDKKR
ncbi:lipopolysaccharide assembly protein LapA domain-containing protein [Paenibacillus sp. J5C_2022]|uniref:LapA family protein n=1 Tax=Paenibacillus sp. J5C2022 TaxID=2977129 RepID=UPI0021CED400|nr:lipopolysaccharide assembly protein LapA domain-containing protein [Paenibacillus sp. J5C2022]MCU6711804.1 lipopolysaccharide assembly protein LapA domain-containing protein [Paenibacillus sp. J5C2022]